MFADAHCDTITRILDNNEELYKNSGHIDLKRLAKAGCCLQFFAIWIAPEYDSDAFERFNKASDKFYNEVEKNNINVVKCAEDVVTDKLCALLTVEGGSVIGRSLGRLQQIYDKGVRLMTLTWNGANNIADGVMIGENAGGLTDFGKEVIKAMNSLGMIIDVSHLSEKGFYDVAESSCKPFFASHSNCKRVCNHPRNLTDEQILHIIKTKGFIGLNFYPDFLGNNANITDIIRHAEHILSLGGEEVLGFGADFDGVDCLPKGIDGVHNMNDVINEFCKLGYSQTLLNKLFYENLIVRTKQILKK